MAEKPKDNKIKVKTDLEFGQIFYIITDPKQLEHQLTGVKIRPGDSLLFTLSHQGIEVELFDFECSPIHDELKYLEANSKDDED